MLSIGSLKPFDKNVNMCLPFKSNLLFAASRAGEIKLITFYYKKGKRDEPLATFEGHTMSVTALAANEASNRLASGGRDQVTKLWDISTEQEISSRLIERNAVTSIKWLPNDPSLFI